MPRSTTSSEELETIVVAFRKHTLLPLDDCLYASPASIPYRIHTVLRDNGTRFTAPGNVRSAAVDIELASQSGENFPTHYQLLIWHGTSKT